MQGINVNDCYSQWFFCYLLNPPQFTQTADSKKACIFRYKPSLNMAKLE